MDSDLLARLQPWQRDLIVRMERPVHEELFEEHSILVLGLILQGVIYYTRRWFLFGPKYLGLTRDGRRLRRAIIEDRDHG